MCFLSGAAGVSAAFAYAGMTSVGVSPEKTLLVMLVVPLLMAIGYVTAILSFSFSYCLNFST